MTTLRMTKPERRDENTMTTTAINVQGLTKNYGAFRALDGLNLTLSTGRIVASQRLASAISRDRRYSCSD